MAVAIAPWAPHSGLFQGNSGPRLVVPVGGWRRVVVRGAGGEPAVSPLRGETFSIERIEADDLPSASQSTSDGALLEVRGLRRGRGEVTIRRGSERLSLRIHVVPQFTTHVNFWFVRDGRFQTQRQVSWVPHALDELNRVFDRQANVRLRLQRQPLSLHVPGLDPYADFGDGVKKARAETVFWNTLREALPAEARQEKVVNVCFVAQWNGRDCAKTGRNVFGTANNTPGDTCVVEDRLPHDRFLLIVAHEVGHLLGCRHNETAGKLMAKSLNVGIGRGLLFDDVRRMRRRFQQT